MGPAVFGTPATQYSYRVALTALIGFFVVRLVLLYFVPAEGRETAAAN